MYYICENFMYYYYYMYLKSISCSRKHGVSAASSPSHGSASGQSLQRSLKRNDVDLDFFGTATSYDESSLSQSSRESLF